MCRAQAVTGAHPLPCMPFATTDTRLHRRKESCPNVSLVYTSVPIMPCKTHKSATYKEQS